MKHISLIMGISIIFGAVAPNAAVDSGAVSVYSTLSGKVTDATSGGAIAGAIVKLGAKIDTTDAEGQYSIDSVPGGAKAISASAVGYETKTTSLTMPDSAYSFDIQLVAKHYVKLSGMIVDSISGSAIEGAIVRIGAIIDTVAADGNFLFDTLQKGNKTVIVTAEGYYQKSVSVTMPDSDVSVFIELSKIIYSTLAGTVVDSVAGTPIEGAIVSIGTSIIDTVAADGIFSFDSLQRGRKTVTVSAEGYYRKTVTITMPDSNLSENILLTKISYSKVSGTVVDSASGTAIGGAVVQFYLNFTFLKSDTADDSGNYIIDSIDSKNITTGYLYIAIPGYGRQTIKVSDTSVDTATINIALTGVLNTHRFVRGKETISIERNQVILTNTKTSGTIRLYNMKGEQLVAEPFPANATFCLELGARLPAGAYIVAVSRKSGGFYRPVILH